MMSLRFLQVPVLLKVVMAIQTKLISRGRVPELKLRCCYLLFLSRQEIHCGKDETSGNTLGMGRQRRND